MTISLILWALIVPLLIVLGVLLWLTEDRKARARRWYRLSMTQVAIAKRVGVSSSTVSRWVKL